MAPQNAVATAPRREAGSQSQSQGGEMQSLSFAEYKTDGFFDEMFDPKGWPRADCLTLCQRIRSMPPDDLTRRQRAADRSMVQLGITFNVYGDRSGQERIIPFDIIPRIVARDEWEMLELGLRQRITALNMLIDDLYHERKVVRDGVLPEQVVATAKGFRPQCVGLNPPRGVWCHITGTDLVRDADGQYYVLEDNLRCPSGVSYVLQNRQLMKQTFPQLFERSVIRPVDDYCSRLLDALQYLMGDQTRLPTVALLSPGMHNSAYFEHSFLAQQMGIHLVEGRDLVVNDGFVYMRTTKGFERIDVLYRRIDDDFLDPKAFRPDSLLGVPGLIEAYRGGRIALANAPGAGIADDKVMYAYVPQIIKYYLGEDAIIPNVPTYVCWEEKQRKHVLANIGELVVKPANESGGYGLMIGPRCTKEEHAKCAELIKADPRNYIAQPMLSLSRVPVLTDDGLEGRHVDLRPFIVYGKDIFVLPGGLTRVALKKGSLVVNSSQGGGSKDTWVVS